VAYPPLAPLAGCSAATAYLQPRGPTPAAYPPLAPLAGCSAATARFHNGSVG